MSKLRKTTSLSSFEENTSRISIEQEIPQKPFPKLILIPISFVIILLVFLTKPTAVNLMTLPIEEQNFLDLKLIHPPKAEDVANDDEWLHNRNYGLVIDAGSSGSRIYVYSWQRDSSNQAIKLEKADREGKVFELKETPGLSTFAVNPEGAGPHLEPLLKFAYSAVPLNKQASTPLYLFATAGMRLVDPLRRQEILDAACAYAKKNYFYYIGECSSHFRVISGELEGIFGWLSVNYLKSKFETKNSFGFIDMGGASAQIAFEPTVKMVEEHSDDLRRVSMRYQNGFGANQARSRYVDKYVDNGFLLDPCLNPGFDISEDGHQLNGTGKFDVCLEKVTPLLNKDIKCPEMPCLFNGVHAPIEDFANHHFIGVSELWYTTFQAYDLGGVYRYNSLMKAASKLCQTPWEDILVSIEKKEFPHVNSQDRMQLHCFKTAYLLGVLHDGLGIPRAPSVDVDKGPLLESLDELDGFSVSWTMGAMFLYASSTIPEQSSVFSGNFFTIIVMFIGIGGVIYYYRCQKRQQGVYTVVDSGRRDQVAISIPETNISKKGNGWY